MLLERLIHEDDKDRHEAFKRSQQQIFGQVLQASPLAHRFSSSPLTTPSPRVRLSHLSLHVSYVMPRAARLFVAAGPDSFQERARATPQAPGCHACAGACPPGGFVPPSGTVAVAAVFDAVAYFHDAAGQAGSADAEPGVAAAAYVARCARTGAAAAAAPDARAVADAASPGPSAAAAAAIVAAADDGASAGAGGRAPRRNSPAALHAHTGRRSGPGGRFVAKVECYGRVVKGAHFATAAAAASAYGTCYGGACCSAQC